MDDNTELEKTEPEDEDSKDYWSELVGIERIWHCGREWACKQTDADILWEKVLLKLPRESTAPEVIQKLIVVRNLRTEKGDRLLTPAELMGGIYRAMYYFPYYYRPIKIITHLKHIDMPSGSKHYKRIVTYEKLHVEGAPDVSQCQAALDKWGM